ncbi:hypothetical protein F5144DRAFT_562324 [Chaetomium tenue]|uniref:Uncharacterized protein n=1 Tax=Chaetomium tenue TaxID=1854479 RepID=A0ACB7PGS5_9PEZI|nr:hypothetical protein F5144DRAFT_562324 [Chaetomium globosum]
MSSATLDNIVGRLATALGDKSYVIIGSAANSLLGIGPVGSSVDVLVPTGTPSRRAEKLCTSRTTTRFKFVTNKGVFYTRENGGKDIPITFWEPKEVHQQCPEEMTDIVMVGNVRVLKPTLLLNIHCHNWLKSQSGPGKNSGNAAAHSIDLLLRHIVKETKKEVSNASGEFLVKFAAAKPETHAGFRDLGILGPH